MTTKKQALANKKTLSKAYPKGINWDIDIPKIDLVRVVDEAIVKFGDKPAMDFLGKKITYNEMGTLINRAAKGMRDMGIKKGDKVGLYMPNTPYYPIMFFAAMRLGATVVNFSPLYTKEELRYQIKDSGTTTMVALDIKEFHDRAVALKKEKALKHVIKCRLSDMLPFPKSSLYNLLKRSEIAGNSDHTVDFRNVINNDGYINSAAIDVDDIAVLQYTGGTSGVPKGAMLSHFNLVANAAQISEYFCDGPGKKDSDKLIRPGKPKMVAAIPYFHVFGMMVSMIHALKTGTEIYLVPNPRDLKQILKTLHKEKPDMFPAVPRLLQAVSEHPGIKGYNLSNLRTVMAGGAALAPGVKKSFEEATKQKDIIMQGYGLTETSPVASSNPPYGKNKPESVGLAYPKTEIKIADPDDPDKIMNIGETGEICIRGPQVMQGYYNKKKETDEILTADGWLRTGDIGMMDKDYYLHIVDRKKRLIIINGYNVYPNQIESAISKHPAVAECIVIGIADDRSGEAAKVFIRFKQNRKKLPNEEELRTFLKDKINRLEIPKYFEFVTEELPKTAVGKPDWKAMQEKERQKPNKTKNTKPTSKPKP